MARPAERIPKVLFQNRIFVRVADFPFWRLVRERWTGERRCVAGRMRGMNR